MKEAINCQESARAAAGKGQKVDASMLKIPINHSTEWGKTCSNNKQL